ncbi:Protein of unknown function [Pyronema omphalodes CBS 100304]|uniref:Uncharacterized protein n=1 Tax=Pyronema omphalodes (strain CBS 100304) TaxID=1076935 RepID=U4LR57_PYROM|nr:Protein of unknown function [Pyronema omphalodes CBS 100304]
MYPNPLVPWFLESRFPISTHHIPHTSNTAIIVPFTVHLSPS